MYISAEVISFAEESGFILKSILPYETTASLYRLDGVKLQQTAIPVSILKLSTLRHEGVWGKEMYGSTFSSLRFYGSLR
jgi:hypothetical protein